jgi:hypothetical protein
MSIATHGGLLSTASRTLARGFFLLAIAACGESTNPGTDPDANVGDDSRLPDDEPCVPDSLRCNGNEAQRCNDEGTMWVTTETCATFCDEGVCAIDGLDVASDMSLDGVVLVAGEVVVRSGATLSSPAGDLTILADTITIEAGGAVAVAPTGDVIEGKGFDGSCSTCSVGGGFYAGRYGSDTDAEVQPGAAGGKQFASQTPIAHGGGVVRLIAKGKLVMAGTITANGANGGSDASVCSRGGGGGSGGGVLIAADDLVFSGSISAIGGLGGVNSCAGNGGNAGEGRVKVLHGARQDITGTVMGRRTQGLMPPIPLRSLSHPDPTKIYNDGFLSFDVEWKKPFPSVMGYYVRLDQTRSRPPTPATGEFLAADKVSFSPNDIFDGDNFVHVVSVDGMSEVGTVEAVLRVQINTRGPSISSSSHPSQTTFSNNTNPFFAWSYPQGDAHITGAHYVLDNFGTTVPTTGDTALPAGQTQLLIPNVPPGVWVLHVVSVDGQGRLSKQAGHYQVRIGDDPGTGSIQGQVVDANSQPIPNATVTVNRGLFTTTTSGSGTFSLPAVTAGTWELSARFGALTATKQITVTAGMSTAGNLTVQ